MVFVQKTGINTLKIFASETVFRFQSLADARHINFTCSFHVFSAFKQQTVMFVTKWPVNGAAAFTNGVISQTVFSAELLQFNPILTGQSIQNLPGNVSIAVKKFTEGKIYFVLNAELHRFFYRRTGHLCITVPVDFQIDIISESVCGKTFKMTDSDLVVDTDH